MTPKAAPKATAIAVALALLLILAGIVTGRDALISFGAVSGSGWLDPALGYIVDLTVQPWMLPAGIAIGVVGLVLLLISVLPRRTTHTLSNAEGVWIGKPRRRRVSSVGRAAAVADRIGTAVFGILLLAVGSVALAWQRGVLPAALVDGRRTFESWTPAQWPDEQWWPWALVGVTIVAVLVGLRWLYAHRPRRQAATIVADADEHARIDLASAARNVAAEFASTPGIDDASARIVQVRRSRVVRISGVADDSGASTEELVASAANIRRMCSDALAGLTVETQVLIDPSRTA